MELKERLRQILKTQYGIETDTDLQEALENMPGIDFGIFVNPQREEIKSA